MSTVNMDRHEHKPDVSRLFNDAVFITEVINRIFTKEVNIFIKYSSESAYLFCENTVCVCVCVCVCKHCGYEIKYGGL